MKFFPFINHFIIKPQGNDTHRYKHIHVLYFIITNRDTKKKCMRHADDRNCLVWELPSSTYIFWIYCVLVVLFIEFCMHVGACMYTQACTGLPVFLCAKILPGYEDSSLWLLLHSQSTLCRREISSISSFMWYGTVEGWGGERLGYHRPYNMCHQCLSLALFKQRLCNTAGAKTLLYGAFVFFRLNKT